MPKLDKREFIVKAAKLYGLSEIEINALDDHLSGKTDDEYIVRRNEKLFELYDIYCSKEYNDKIDPDEDGIINLNDYSFVFSNRRLLDSKIGRVWIVSSNLEAYLSVVPPDSEASDIYEKYEALALKNDFLLPQIAKQMGLDATVYYRGVFTNDLGMRTTHHLTKNFLYDDETLIQGNSIIKDNPDKRRISLETILESTEKYIKKHYKKYKLPQADMEKARDEIKKGLIKQTFFNKFVFNQYEGNEKWGLISDKNNQLRLAPLYSYNYCCGVDFSKKVKHRTVGTNKEDLESFMLAAGNKHPWFKQWVNEAIVHFDLDKAAEDMKRKTGIELRDVEKEYYKYMFDKMLDKVYEIVDVDYDKEEFYKNRKVKLGKKIKTLKYTLSDKISDAKYKREQKNSNHDGR